MNTPTHALLSLALLQRAGGRTSAPAILCGAVLPDLPMFAFYLYQKVVARQAERAIWDTHYFAADWQLFFDVFNSIPLALLVLGWSARKKSVHAVSFALAWLLHCAMDLPLHHDDAHRHFLPFSEYRYASPVSYWDPRYYGRLAATCELFLLAVSAWIVARSARSRLVAAMLLILVLGCASAYGALYWTSAMSG